MRAAHEAPRCQHIKHNGRRCAAPALRGDNHCHFHNRIQFRALNAEDAEPFLPFVEDATSLQFALMRVMRLLQIGHSFEYKRCALLLYSMQIAASNLKAFMAEQPKPELAEGEQPQAKLAGSENGKMLEGKNGDEPSLAERLLELLAKPGAQPPQFRSREDYLAAVKRGETVALPETWAG